MTEARDLQFAKRIYAVLGVTDSSRIKAGADDVFFTLNSNLSSAVSPDDNSGTVRPLQISDLRPIRRNSAEMT